MAIVLIYCSSQTHASNEKDAQRFLDWAQAKFLDLLNPPSAELNRAQGYAYRYFKTSGVYLALYGDQVYGIGGPLGDKLVSGGDVANFIVKSVNDQTDKTLSLRQAECSNYVSKNVAAVTDLYSKEILASNLNISLSGEECVFISNSLPNHDFGNSTRSFAHPALAVPTEYRITAKPKFASKATPISLTTDNAIFLNGVKLDLLAAGCFGIGDGKIGCNDLNQKWRYDPMSPSANFGTDEHNAHTQPDGTYHYHAGPSALFPEYPTKDSPVIGFAADGFPIFGSYSTDDSGSLRAAKSSYQLKNGMRPSEPGNPDGQYDGTFIDDYEFIADSGDLDECNGMMRAGVYGYYVTDSYPWVLGCFKGTPNLSFNKRGRKEVSLPKIEIVNYTEFDTERFLKLGMAVIQKARRRIRDLSIWIWPVGKQIKEGFAEAAVVQRTAEAEAKGLEAKAVGVEKHGTAEAEVMRLKYSSEANGIEEKAGAMKLFDAVGKDHEEFKLRLNKDLEIEKAAIDAQRQIAEAQSNIVGEALKSARIDIVGGETTFFDKIVDSVKGGKAVDRFVYNSQVATDIKDTFFNGDPEYFQARITELTDTFNLSTDDVKDLSIAALIAKMLGLTSNNSMREELQRMLGLAHTSGVADNKASSVIRTVTAASAPTKPATDESSDV